MDQPKARRAEEKVEHRFALTEDRAQAAALRSLSSLCLLEVEHEIVALFRGGAFVAWPATGYAQESKNQPEKAEATKAM